MKKTITILAAVFVMTEVKAQCPVTITATPTAICTGSTSTLTASGASTYTWSANAGGATTASVVVTPTVSTTYTVTATTGTCTATQTVMVTVNPLPTVTVNSATICMGQQTATLTASGASTYSWTPATGLSSTTGGSVTANPTVTTSYTVTGTSTAGCKNTATSIVTVNPLPTVTVNSATICAGSSATLTAAGASTYSWTPATGLSSTTGGSVTANPTVTTSYTVTGTSTAGCVNTASTSVTLNPSPTVTVNSPTICAGSTATLTASGAATYTWSTGASGASITVTPTVTTNYTVTGTNTQGCMKAAMSTVTVNTVMPTVTAVATATMVCPGTWVKLTAGGATTYIWSANAGSATTATVSVAPTSNTTYTVTGTTNACSGTATVTINTYTATPPVATTSATPASCPSNSNATATVTASGTGTLTYSWMPGGFTTATVTGLIPGIYTVMVKDATPCATTKTVNVGSTASGTLQTTFAGGNGVVGGNMFDITATNTSFITSFDCYLDTATAGAANDSVKIYFIPSTYVGSNANPAAWTYVGGRKVMSSGMGVPTVIPIGVNHSIPAGQTHGFYITRTKAILRYTNGTAFGATYVSNTDFAIKEGNGVAYPFGSLFPATGTGSRIWNGIVHYCNTVGVEEYLSTVNSVVYPQPMIDQATIKITGLSTQGEVTLKVYDAMGKLVKTGTSKNAEEISVSKENLVNGMYFYNVYDSQNKIISKGKLAVQ